MGLDVYDKIIKYENGELDDIEVVGLFSVLIKTGLAWQLQGSYGRQAKFLIESGMLDRDGNIIEEAYL